MEYPFGGGFSNKDEEILLIQFNKSIGIYLSLFFHKFISSIFLSIYLDRSSSVHIMVCKNFSIINILSSPGCEFFK